MKEKELYYTAAFLKGYDATIKYRTQDFSFHTHYTFKSVIPLKIGGIYDIMAMDSYGDINRYNNYIIVLNIKANDLDNVIFKKTIVKARPISPKEEETGNKIVYGNKIVNVHFNKEKGITAVKWKDGTVTKVKCAEDDTYSCEVGLALCHMKYMYNNSSSDYHKIIEYWKKRNGMENEE